jgi:hypothetical protein
MLTGERLDSSMAPARLEDVYPIHAGPRLFEN